MLKTFAGDLRDQWNAISVTENLPDQTGRVTFFG